MDQRIRYPEIPEDKVFGVSNADEVIEILDKYADKYNKFHKGIVIDL